jgi:hypothetical protein
MGVILDSPYGMGRYLVEMSLNLVTLMADHDNKPIRGNSFCGCHSP